MSTPIRASDTTHVVMVNRGGVGHECDDECWSYGVSCTLFVCLDCLGELSGNVIRTAEQTCFVNPSIVAQCGKCKRNENDSKR